MKDLKLLLDGLYKKLNRRDLVDPDPLIFLYDFDDVKDREIVGLIASSVADGRVAQILKSVRKLLEPMNKQPFDFIDSSSEKDFLKIFKGFKHRFTTDEDIATLFIGIKKALNEYVSLENLFLSGNGKTTTERLAFFTSFINGGKLCYLLPSPQKGSACKRLNLYLKWMVRKDDVDPGGWTKVDPADLIIPLDTHMHTASKILGLTKRKAADFKTAIEVTEKFKKICPEDPTKYDFALTRLGIRSEMSFEDLDLILNPSPKGKGSSFK